MEDWETHGSIPLSHRKHLRSFRILQYCLLLTLCGQKLEPWCLRTNMAHLKAGGEIWAGLCLPLHFLAGKSLFPVYQPKHGISLGGLHLSFPLLLFGLSAANNLFSSHRVTASRLAPDRIKIENDILENGQCISTWCFVRSRQRFKPRKWLWFFSTVYQCVESKPWNQIFTPNNCFMASIKLSAWGRAIFWWFWFKWTQTYVLQI